MKFHRYFIGFNLAILCWIHGFSFNVLQIGEKWQSNWLEDIEIPPKLVQDGSLDAKLS